MENAEEILQILERFTKLKQKDIPKELDEYLIYVAKTGDTVFTWSNIKYLFREKLIHVIKDFHDSTSNIDDLPQYPNVDPFNYETMKTALLERLELFNSAPFTIQRICELLTNPKKQYSRIDKYMRALEKNILVVSTIEPGRKQPESENGDSLDSVVISLDVNVDIEMENENIFNVETQRQQNGSNGTGSSAINSKFDTENNKTHEDVELPLAKKPKLDSNDDEYTKNEVIRKDEKTENENLKKEDDLKNDNSDKTSENKDSENEEKKEDKTDLNENNVEKSSEETEISEIITKNEEKCDTPKEAEDKYIPEKDNNENHVANDNSIEDNLVINENKKTDDPTQEEEDKLLNVEDEQTSKDCADAKEEEKNPTMEDKISLEDNESKLLEEIIPEKGKNEFVEKDDSASKSCDSTEEKRIELFSTDDVVDPSEEPKKTLPESEIDIPTQTAEELITNKSIDVTEEKFEISSEDTKTSEKTVVEKQKQMEDMAVEEAHNISETITPISLDEKVSNVSDSITESNIESTTIPEPQASIDQPMEDPIISDNPVDIESAPIDATSCVEMQTADSNEMATDDVSPPKIDEKSDLSGMDVDDVSQGEAMDQ